MSGLAEVQARIMEITGRFPISPMAGRLPSSAASGSASLSFADTLASASARAGTAATDFGLGSVPTAGLAGTATGEQVVTAATKYLGVPYVWGGTDPATGLDCSGLVQQVYADLGVKVPRVSQDQAKAGSPVASLAQAKPGDLIAFGSPADHIGIYAGLGKMIVAPKSGDVVKIQDIYRTPSAIRRILPDPTAATAATGLASAGQVSTVGSQPFASLFASAGARHGVSPALLSAVAQAESGYNPTASSPAGAQGLMQLMPATARELGADPWDPASAINGAAKLLSGHLKEFGSIELALAAYNAGPGAVRRHGGIPPYAETQKYVRTIVAQLQGNR
ncbi:MAG: transglycosylase SLT domain-containing protein [Frankiales bacterium]|nr:transglycosylase SLT domain-containing protein [Frankiales bacterium]